MMARPDVMVSHVDDGLSVDNRNNAVALQARQALFHPAERGVSTYRIAVVDDDEGVLESLTNLLESHDYVVHAYASASALLDDDIIGRLDCLISDVSMPRMDGFQLRRLLEEQWPALPVILITARPDVGDHGVSSRNNRGLLQKPFACGDLLDALAAAIAQTH